MAIIHDAQLSPTKPELIEKWLPRQPWFRAAEGPLEVLGAYRFDDPYGEVGIETHFVRGADGTVYQVPLTYRGAPMRDAGRYLVTEMQHSVLGDRWVYDAAADPVYVAALAAAIFTGGREADGFADGADEPLPNPVRVRGTGTMARAPQATLVDLSTDDGITTIRTDSAAIRLRRVLDGTTDDRLRLDLLEGVDGAPATLAVVVAG
ncbi:MAG: hypothetical protein GXX90_00775 [Microbacteriaceae bacterium]|nr:hypothetical protein [Microbacteriaceae bacterium]